MQEEKKYKEFSTPNLSTAVIAMVNTGNSHVSAPLPPFYDFSAAATPFPIVITDVHQ